MNRFKLIVVIALAAGCSSPSNKHENNSLPNNTNSSSTCDAMSAFPDPEDIPLTPREDLEIETIALRCSDGWVADQPVYDTLAADIGAIRAADTAMAALRDYSLEEQQLLLEVSSDEVLQSYIDGSDEEFACVADTLGGVTSAWQRNEGSWGFLTFDGVFHLPGVAGLVGSLEDVLTSEPNYIIGDGPSIKYDIREEPRRYLFDDAGGDCPAGCTTHHYFLWEVTDAGPTLVAEWGYDDIEMPFGEAPDDFVFDDFVCRRCEDGRVAQGGAEVCDDRIDNDCNGQTDCKDTACAGQQVCEYEDCSNGIDDDADGAEDCDDDECEFNAECGTLTCGSPEDREFLERQRDRGVLAFVLRDALACDQEVERDPDLTIASCITRTFTTNDASYGCGRCLGELGECAMTDCRDECLPDFDQPVCTDCVDTTCAAAVETCLGEPYTAL